MVPHREGERLLVGDSGLAPFEEPPTSTRQRRPAFQVPLNVGLVSMPSARALKVLKPPFMSFDQEGMRPQRIGSVVRTPSFDVMTGTVIVGGISVSSYI